MPAGHTSLLHVLDQARTQLDPLLAGGPRALVVDLSGLDRLSSTSIASLLWLNRRCTGRGVDVRLRGATRQVVDTLRRMGLLNTLSLESEVGYGQQLPGNVVTNPEWP